MNQERKRCKDCGELAQYVNLNDNNQCEDCASEMSQSWQDGKPENRGIASRNHDHNVVYRHTGDRRAAIRAYCAGNKWLEENAKAVGNW